jgi:hypothetical protein
MKVFLDDVRPTPENWSHCYWPDEVIALLETGEVTHLSLDHDLGDDERGTGYDVLLWIEKKVFECGFDGGFIPPEMTIHSANPVARNRMQLAINMIWHHFKVCNPILWDEIRNRI